MADLGGLRGGGVNIRKGIERARKMGIPEEAIRNRVDSELGAGAYDRTQSGFGENLGADVSGNIKGIMALPGALLNALFNPSSLPELGGKIVSGAIKEYKGLAKHPIESLRTRPVSTALDVLPFLSVGKSKLLSPATKLGKAGEIENATIRSILGSGAEESLATKGLSKVGGAVETIGKRQALKGIRPSPSQQRAFRKLANQSMEDFATERNLFSPTIEKVTSKIEPLQDSFDTATLKSTKMVSKKRLLSSFDEEIGKLKKLQGNRVNRRKLKFLQDERDYVNKQLYPQDKVSISDLTTQRRSIDKVTKDFKLDPSVASDNRLLGSIYRKTIQESTSGLKELGSELNKLYAFRDIVELQSGLGKGTKLLNPMKLGAAAGGGVVGGIPGIAAGVVTEAALNEPKVAGFVSKSLQKAGRGIKGTNVNIPEFLRPSASKVATGAVAGRQLQQGSPSVTQPSNIGSQEILSPGGQWKWNGNDWVPNQQAQQAQQTITNEQISQAAQQYLQTNGTKGLKDYVNTLQLIQGLSGGGAGGVSNVGKVSADKFSNAKTGTHSLQQVKSLIYKPNGEINREVLVAYHTPGRPNEQSRMLGALMYNMADAFLRIRTGAQANPTEIEKLAKNMTPGVTDPKGAVQTKLAVFEDVFKSILDLAANQ